MWIDQARRIVGAEVPIPGSDKLRWIDLTIPSSAAAAPASPSDPFVCMPPRAALGRHIIPLGDSQYYLSWRIHEEHPNALEVIELSASKEFPSFVLRLVFQEALCPFAFLCERREEKHESTNSAFFGRISEYTVGTAAILLISFLFIQSFSRIRKGGGTAKKKSYRRNTT